MMVPTIVLTEVIEREGDQFASYCHELDIASCGDTAQEAYENIQDAIELYLNGLEQMGLREQVFSEKGIVVEYENVDVDPVSLRVPVSRSYFMMPSAPMEDKRTARYRVPAGVD